MGKLYTLVKSILLVVGIAMVLYIGWMSSILLVVVVAVFAVYLLTRFLLEFKRRASL